MHSVEVEGKTLNEAINKALALLKAKRSEVKIDVLSEEKKGLFGLKGEKPAKIRATIIDKEHT
jgi:spoIIIJ-associated protein